MFMVCSSIKTQVKGARKFQMECTCIDTYIITVAHSVNTADVGVYMVLVVPYMHTYTCAQQCTSLCKTCSMLFSSHMLTQYHAYACTCTTQVQPKYTNMFLST